MPIVEGNEEYMLSSSEKFYFPVVWTTTQFRSCKNTARD